MFRILRVPPFLDKFVRPLPGHFHWDHFTDFRRLVLAMAVMWGRRHVAHLARYLEAVPHRTRFNHVVLVERWAPEAALRQQAQDWLPALPPGTGATLAWIMDDSKTAKRGQALDAMATMKDPTIDADIRGHQEVGAIRLYRDHVMPVGLRL